MLVLLIGEWRIPRKGGRVVSVSVDFDAVNNILRATIEGRITGEILLNSMKQRRSIWLLIRRVASFSISHP